MGGNLEFKTVEGLRDFPRILIINCEPLNSKTATGLTMMSLFREWPQENLAQLYTHPVIPDPAFCVRTRRISIRPLNISQSIKAWFSDQPAGQPNKWPQPPAIFKVSECPGIQPGFKYRLQDKIKARLKQVAFLRTYQVSDELLSWIRGFQPDIIYSMLYDIDIMSMVINLSQRFRLPVLPHFMDDWPATLKQRNVFYRLLEPALSNKLKEVLKRSPLGLVIGDDMAAAFEKRYQRVMIPFMHCIEPEIFQQKNHSFGDSKTVRFIYIGGLHLNRWESLLEIGKAMSELAIEGLQLECLIYTHPHDVNKYKKLLTIPPVMKIKGSLEHDEVYRAQLSADCLIHVESFNAWDISFAQLSVSSKLPEYLAAGRPILAYGPQEVASIRYIDKIGCGLIVGQKDPKQLKNIIRAAVIAPERRNQLGDLALAAAKSRHEATKQREELRKTILQACQIKFPAYE